MMAVDLHNRELLLPSQLYNPQEDHLGSELSSPIGSDRLCSSSTESSREEEEEEDDYIGELTRQMAQYMLPDEDKVGKPWDLPGSPESTLWSQFGSNLNSPVGPSREPSPPLTPMVENFEKMKINEETARYNQGEPFSTISNSIQVSGGNLNAKKSLIDDQIRAIQFYRLKQEQAMKQTEQKLQKPRTKHYHQGRGRVLGGFNNGHKAAPNSNNPWYNLPQPQQLQQGNQQTGSHMRAVFLNASGSRSGSSGTGVFLPRGIGGNPTESRKKQGCATVLIPARVVQALKLHFEKTGVPTRSNNSGFPPQHDACGSGRNQNKHSLHKGPSKAAPAMNLQEMCLPQEWTY